MPVTVRDKTTASQQLAIASDGSITASLKGNGVPPARSFRYWTVDQFASASASDALLTVTQSVDGAATTTFTSTLVGTGKTLRITALTAALEASPGGSTVISRCYIGIRFNTAGAATTSSPLMYRVGIQVAAAQKNITSFFTPFPDGMEFVGDGTKQIGITAIFPDWVTSTNLTKLTLSVLAYEY